MRYDVIYHFIQVLRHKIIKNEIMTLYVLTCSFYQKTSRSKVFPYEIPVWMNCSRTFYNHFENFRKIKFQWEIIFKIPPVFFQCLLNFQFENGFELPKNKRIEIRDPFRSRAYFRFSLCHSISPNNGPLYPCLCNCRQYLEGQKNWRVKKNSLYKLFGVSI